MRKRKWRKILLGLLLSGIFVIQMALPVSADESGLLVDGSLLTNESESTSNDPFDFQITVDDPNQPVPFTLYLFGGSAQIVDAGNGQVTMYGNTKAGAVCDTVKVDIYLQYYSNGSWVHVNNFNYTVKNTSYISRSRTVSVTKGRYYRVKCYHAITKNGVKENCTSVTNGIKIQ